MFIENIQIKNNLVLAPMAGVTDLPFRLLCKEQGCGMVSSEMVSAKAILYNNKNTDALLNTLPEERPVSIQLFGSDPVIMADMAKRLEDEGRMFDIIDINMGCPVPKVVNNGEGSALMQNPQLVGRIVGAVAKAVKSPVTVKIRKGFSDDTVNAPEIAHIIEESGGACVAVHGRTRQQYYSGSADWDIIRQVKEKVKIPVIGNGDITCGADAAAMFEQTGCDAVMIGRAARGNPWIFREIAAYLENGAGFDAPTDKEVREIILRHAKLLIQYKGEYTGIREMRKHFAWYTAGFPHSSMLRNRVNFIESFEELEKLVNIIGNC